MATFSVLAAEFWRLRFPILIVISAIMWFWTRNSPPGLAAIVHYAWLVALAVGVVGAVSQNRYRRQLWIRSGAAATVVIILLYALIEKYDASWEHHNATKYVDTHRRWNGEVIYRWYERPQDQGLASFQGPVVDGKRHGRWQHWQSRPPKVDILWFWQDEEVSEEEWRRRADERPTDDQSRAPAPAADRVACAKTSPIGG